MFEYKLIAAKHFQKIIDALNEWFPDLPIFNITKLFNPKYYPTDEEDMIRATNVWLEMLMEKFVSSENDCEACRAEMLELVKTIQHECPQKSIHEASSLCGCTLE